MGLHLYFIPACSLFMLRLAINNRLCLPGNCFTNDCKLIIQILWKYFLLYFYFLHPIKFTHDRAAMLLYQLQNCSLIGSLSFTQERHIFTLCGLWAHQTFVKWTPDDSYTKAFQIIFLTWIPIEKNHTILPTSFTHILPVQKFIVIQ